MGNMCSNSRLCGSVRGSFTLSLFSNRGSQKTDEWMQCIENSASCASHRQQLCVSACIPKPLATNSKQATGYELCTAWADNSLVCSDIHPPLPRGEEIVTWRQSPPRWGGTVVPQGGLDKGAGGMYCMNLGPCPYLGQGGLHRLLWGVGGVGTSQKGNTNKA